MARYKFSLNWNRKFAADGTATAACVSEIVRNFVCGNFINVDKCDSGSMGAFPSLDAILALEPGDELTGWCQQDDSRASWAILRTE